MSHQCATPGCGCPADVTICRACRADLEHLLEGIPDLADELTTTLSRQCVHGAAGGRRGAEQPLPYDLGASEADAALRAALVGCIRAVDEDPDHHPRNEPAAMAGWLLERIEQVVADDGAGDMLGELRTATGRAQRAISGPTPRIPLGLCGAVASDKDGALAACPADLTIRNIDQAFARCRTCRTQHDVPGRIDRVRTEASGMLLPIRDITRLAAFLGEASDTARTERLINTWDSRKRILPAGSSPTGRRLFRVGEVFDRLRATSEGKSS